MSIYIEFWGDKVINEQEEESCISTIEQLIYSTAFGRRLCDRNNRNFLSLGTDQSHQH